MSRWLMKSEPQVFGLEDLAAAPGAQDRWDGVRSHQVRNMIRDHMAPGQTALLYHSNIRPPGVVGVMEIVSDPYPDPTALDPEDPGHDPRATAEAPRWYCVDVALRERLPRTVTLEMLRRLPAMEGSPLVRRGNRLSIVPLTEPQWQAILELAHREEG